jgi:hypothetical protein
MRSTLLFNYPQFTRNFQLKLRLDTSLYVMKIRWPGPELNRRRQPFQAALYQLITTILQQLNSAEWPTFCDHSVTSADVRLASALRAKHRQFDTRREPFVLEVAPIPDYFLFCPSGRNASIPKLTVAKTVAKVEIPLLCLSRAIQ